MKRIAKLSLVVAVAASALSAASITVKAGSPEGNYTKVAGKSMVKQGKKQGLSVTLKTSNGSGENIEAVRGTRNVAAFAQRNVVTYYQDTKEGYDSVEEVATIGKECGFLVVPAVNNIPLTLTDIAGEKIAIGAKTSGTAITFNQLASANPALAEFSVKNKGGERTLGKVESGRLGGMFFVSVPDPKNPLIKEVVNNSNLAFANISSLSLGEYGEGKKPDLTHERVPVDTNITGSKVTQRAPGICTSIDVIVDADKMPEPIQSALYQASKDVRVQKATMFSLFNDAKSAASSAVNKLK